MDGAPASKPRGLREPLIGFGAAIALTTIPFALVAAKSVPVAWSVTSIAVCGLAQLFVHLRYFLRLDFRPSSRHRLLAIGFAAIIVFLVVGGTAWITVSLHARMLPR